MKKKDSNIVKELASKIREKLGKSADIILYDSKARGIMKINQYGRTYFKTRGSFGGVEKFKSFN